MLESDLRFTYFSVYNVYDVTLMKRMQKQQTKLIYHETNK